MAGKGNRPTREQTDARLQEERGKTDEEFVKRTRAAEAEADQILNTARERAADVIASARAHADDQTMGSPSSSAERRSIGLERSHADEVLRREYAQADEAVGAERAAHTRLMAELLGQERQETDRSLLLERVDADVIVGHRDEFLGMVSHDLRNELSGVALSIGQILKYVPDDEAGRTIYRSATNIQRINLRMSRLIGDLLDVVAIDSGRFTIVPEEHDVCGTVEDIVESFGPIASAKGIALTVNVVDGALTARFDRHRIQQVLGNLLTNALKYTSEQGTIAVRVARKGEEVCFLVEDSGSGIPSDRLETIFDRFARAGRRDGKGLGLGLFIARRIVEAHGGRIWAESEPSRGSASHFTLPARW